MILYHGSKDIISQPVYGRGNIHNDYGMAFYCTQEKSMACEWAIQRDRDGYCNKYELDTTGLNVLYLNGEEYTVIHWITVLLENRIFNIQTDFGKEAIQYLFEHFMPSYKEADVIVGYRADDSYFSYASDFINNTISVETLARAMKLGELGEQVAIKSRKAFEQLRYCESEVVMASKWFASKEERDRRARKQYQEMKVEKWRRGQLYIMGILDEEVDPTDVRLR